MSAYQDIIGTDRYKSLLEIMGDVRLPDAQRAAARAQLDVALANDQANIIQATRENLYAALAGLASEVAKASAASDTTARSIVLWTRVLAVSTVVLA